MAADNELPVWPFQPNWREPITERLSWATVVMTSDSGSEQRYSSRLSPRREFEALFNPTDDTRTFFDLFISELGGQEMMVPLWHDRHKLTTAVTNGDNRVDCDTEYGEFTDGGLAIILGADAWSHQVVEIDTVDANGFSLSVNATFDWPIGGTILPLRRSRLDLQPALSNITSRVSEVTLRFLLNQANDLPDDGAWTGLTYSGYPVMTTESDWKNGIDIGFSRITETEDNGTGIAFIRDIADRAFRTKTHTWHLRGRQENWEFRQFLYRMGGRRSPIWMPTGLQDMVVAVTAAAGAGNVNVRQVGLTYVGGPQPGRDRFLASTGEGYQVRQISSLGAPLLPSYERLNLNANLTYTLPAGTKLSFLEIMRADGDDIELLHHTDVEGVTECSINFRSFNDARVPATPISLALPSDVEDLNPCGTADESETPCLPVPFEGWAWEWVWVTETPSGPPGFGTVFSVLNTPNPFSLVSNGSDVDPVNGPKFSYAEEVVGIYYRQIMKMVHMPVSGNYGVIMDPNNLYPYSRFFITGRPYDTLVAGEYWTSDYGTGGFARSGNFVL